METEEFPARLHIIIARKEPVAVIFRRGPSKHVATIGWNLRKDEFSLGQWFKGRIYEYRCDLSPNGKFLLYFAANWKNKNWTKGTWTAISKAPFLKAVDLWYNGSAWNGGGLFMNNSSVWLNTPNAIRGNNICARQNTKFRFSESFPFDVDYGGECPGVYFHRLKRDGWNWQKETPSSMVFNKPLNYGWTLMKNFVFDLNSEPGHGCYWEQHRLIHDNGIDFIDGDDWRWADYDKDRKRILFTNGGGIYSINLWEKLSEPLLLRDFTDMKFEPVAAPY